MSASPTPDEAAFTDHYFRFATPDDMPDSATERSAMALGHRRWGARRDPDEILVRVFNPKARGAEPAHTVIETITDDSPFIVDSLTMQLNTVAQGILVKLHSVFTVERSATGRLKRCVAPKAAGPNERGTNESWTHFEIPRVIDEEERNAIARLLEATLRDVRKAVDDWPRMLERLQEAADDLRRFGGGKDVDEACRFLEWLADHHFTLLGYCRLPGKAGVPSLGVLEKKSRRDALNRSRRQGDRNPSLTIAKATMKSTVHRPALLDDIRVDAFSRAGEVTGEHRFVGLFTSTAYNESARDIPLLRSKVSRVLKRSGLDPHSHRGKALVNILETFPRDELIQADVPELERIGIGVLNIEERRKIRLFVTESPYRDFYFCLVYLPRDGYGALARDRIETLLADALSGDLIDSQLTISESTLARISLTIKRRRPDGETPDFAELERRVAETALAWIDRARLALLERFPEGRALDLHHRFVDTFPSPYRESVADSRIARDFSIVADLASGEKREHYELDIGDEQVSFCVYRRGGFIPLYRANPILENLGVRLLRETNYELEVDGEPIGIQDFLVEPDRGQSLGSGNLAQRFVDCFRMVLEGAVENDGFNSLVVAAGLTWRQVVVLRCYCKYLLQCRSQFSQSYILDTLRRHPGTVRAYIELFESLFDPGIRQTVRDKRLQVVGETIRDALERTSNLDEDRILRMFAAALNATLRTNFYQSDDAPKPWLALKLDPSRIPEVPLPRPKFEIFVYSPAVEGVHLRGGAIARGGLRWSDRREDFRTEVLGLMKAQQVKNTVIVPVGAKGGFVLKQPPADGAMLRETAIECYRTFLRGLLDLTDNIVGDRSVPPAATVCRDAPDPYLVVAADKGTATFSDDANVVAAEYDFWLGDAFASGGSAGYDHKKMGITARGAWESVRRHFRELGLDSQKDPFRVIGIGDMSGDVFGNGMLLSGTLRLIAAFNHRHIFIDPDPDPAQSYAERQRLFAVPRSGWDDYDRKLISRGGGVFDRTSKMIPLSPEARTALGVDDDELTPPDLIRAILKAPVDLLWNGGIGTYVKSAAESQSDAMDPANDPVRVNGSELRTRIVAEGGNLGLTQRGRIEYALAGGKINTDFIDNSAGVDSSDREVNIKILLGEAIRRQALAPGRRNALLKAMTDEVAALVVASNYAQTQALSMMMTKARERIGEHARLIRILESRGVLNRALEDLPSEDEIEERRHSGDGFTRPELAVILSYAKIELFESLLDSDLPDEPHCRAEVLAYFPKRLARRFPELIATHRLRREIATMLISGSVINRMGPFFVLRAEHDTGCSAADVARAYTIVRGLVDTRAIWHAIEALDGELLAQVQYECFFECSRMLRRAVYWFLHRRASGLDIEQRIERARDAVSAMREHLPSVLCGWSKRSYERDIENFESLAVPKALAERIAELRLLTQILDIGELAHDLELAPLTVAEIYFNVGRGLRLDWIREQIELLEVEGHWRAMARSTLRETLGREQRKLAEQIFRLAGTGDARAALAEWLTTRNAEIARLKRTLDEMQGADAMDFATLSIALQEVGRLH